MVDDAKQSILENTSNLKAMSDNSDMFEKCVSHSRKVMDVYSINNYILVQEWPGINLLMMYFSPQEVDYERACFSN